MSRRRSQGGMRSSSASSTRSGSGPPSTSMRAPVRVSSRIESPCPTSRTVRRVSRWTASPRAAPAIAMAIATPTSPRRSVRPMARLAPGLGAAVAEAAGRLARVAGSWARMRGRTAGAPRIAIPDSAAAAVAMPGGRVTAANGSEAPTRTTSTIRCRTSQPGQAGERREERRCADHRQAAHEHRDEAAQHRRRHQRDDGEVDDRRDQRQPAEGGEDVGERRGLGRQRDPEALREPAWQPAAADPPEALREGRGPGEQAGRGHDREPEPRVLDHRWVDEQQECRGHAEGRRCAPGSSALAGRERDAGHDGGPDDGRRSSGGHDVRDDRPEDAERHHSPRSPAQDGGNEPGNDRDVPAGDRDDVADAGRSEVGGEGAIDALAQPDQDPGGQSRLGLGEGEPERVPARVAERLEAERSGLLERERPAVERAGRARASQVVAVWVVVRRRTEASCNLDDITRRDRRECRERRRDGDLAVVGVQAQPRDLLPVPRRSDRLHGCRPWAPILGERWRGRRRRPEQHPDGQGDGADPGGDACPAG